MSFHGFERFYPSIYKGRMAGLNTRYGGGIGSSSTYSGHSAPFSYASSRRSYSTHSRVVPSYSSVPLSAPVTTAATDLHLDQAAQVSSEFKLLRTQEKAELQDLNDRFVSFINKVHDLEQQNKLLETELLLLKQGQTQPSHLKAMYEQEIHQLHAVLDAARGEKQAAQDHKDQLENVFQSMQKQYEEEVLAREEAEGHLVHMRKGADEAALVQTELEKRVGNLLDELDFLKRVCESEIAELQAHIQYTAEVRVEMEVTKPDLSASLRNIRAQYEKLTQHNLQSAEEWFTNKMKVMTVGSTRDIESARSAKDEAGECRRVLGAKSLEIKACREMNQVLENQIQDVEEKQSAEIQALQDTISQLEDDLRANKADMARYLKDYQELLNVKMALDIEIAAYRKLLEGEESRLNMSAPPHSVYPQALYCNTSFGYPTLLSSAPPLPLSSPRWYTSTRSTKEKISASHAQQEEASPPQEQEEGGEEVEEGGEEGNWEEGEEEEESEEKEGDGEKERDEGELEEAEDEEIAEAEEENGGAEDKEKNKEDAEGEDNVEADDGGHDSDEGDERECKGEEEEEDEKNEEDEEPKDEAEESKDVETEIKMTKTMDKKV